MKLLKQVYRHFQQDSLYRNSIYLIISTAVMAGFGFFFWMIGARLYTTEQVGLATTLISIMSLISSFSLLGLGNSLIRYLPKSTDKNSKINTSFTLVGLASIIICVFYLLFINFLSPKLSFVRDNIFLSLVFLLFAVFSSWNMLSEYVLIAYRSTNYILVKNTILSMAKLTLPIFLVTMGAFGIFTSVGIATVIAVLFVIIILVKRINCLFKPTLNFDDIRQMIKFSVGNHIAGFIGGSSGLILPILITNTIGAKYSAYFYIDYMIASFLYIIPLAASQSLLAEGSYNQEDLKLHLKKAVTIISVLLIPAIILTLLLGNYILAAFGENYAREGFQLLKLLTIAGIFVAVNYTTNTILNLYHKIRLLVGLNVIMTALVLLFSLVFLKLNLVGIGIGWLTGQAVSAFICLILLNKMRLAG
jgi:O-antigen/teichoic acid export membrane protein